MERLRGAAVRLRLNLVARVLRAACDRGMHPIRRYRLRRHLRRSGVPRRVLFMCEGNIYRSPYAAHAFMAMTPAWLRGSIHVESAGFVGPDRPTPEPAVAAALRRGVDLRAHRSSLITGERAAGAELIVVVDPRQRRSLTARYPGMGKRVVLLGDLDPSAVTTRAIPDPWNQPASVLEQSYDRITRCVQELVRLYL